MSYPEPPRCPSKYIQELERSLNDLNKQRDILDSKLHNQNDADVLDQRIFAVIKEIHPELKKEYLPRADAETIALSNALQELQNAHTHLLKEYEVLSKAPKLVKEPDDFADLAKRIATSEEEVRQKMKKLSNVCRLGRCQFKEGANVDGRKGET
jgi:G3E family GTPase